MSDPLSNPSSDSDRTSKMNNNIENNNEDSIINNESVISSSIISGSVISNSNSNSSGSGSGSGSGNSFGSGNVSASVSGSGGSGSRNNSPSRTSPLKRISSRQSSGSVTTTSSSPRTSYSDSRSNSDNVVASASLISGYLFKQTRDGRWQRRWFETNGTFLTYYKSRKMERLLAALSLPQVGNIVKLPNDKDKEGKEGLFALELNTRVYYLRAKTDTEAEYWVNTLTRLRDEGLSNEAVQAIRISTIHSSSSSPSSTPSPVRNRQGLGLATQDSMRNSRSDWEKTIKYQFMRYICCCLRW